MDPIRLKPAYALSTIIILMIVQAAGGLFIDNLYRDNTFITSGWWGNDLVTLVVAVPLLAGALLLSPRGAKRAQLVWLGMLDYTLYNYAFYLFGAAINAFFPIYVALFVLSMFALIWGLANLDIKGIGHSFRSRTPVKWISGYMMLWAGFLGVVWLGQWANFVVTGQVPQVGGSEEIYRLIAALDLSLVVALTGLGPIWLWQRRPWGYVLAAVLNVKGVVYTLVLTAGSVSGANAGIAGAMDLVPVWIFLAAGCLMASAFLLGNMQPDRQHSAPFGAGDVPSVRGAC